MTPPDDKADGTDAALTAKRISAWWPFFAATVVVIGGYFGFDGRLKTTESGQTRIEAQVAGLTAKIDAMILEQGRVAVNLSIEQKKDSDKYADRLSAIEKALGKIEGRLDAAKDK